MILTKNKREEDQVRAQQTGAASPTLVATKHLNITLIVMVAATIAMATVAIIVKASGTSPTATSQVEAKGAVPQEPPAVEEQADPDTLISEKLGPILACLNTSVRMSRDWYVSRVDQSKGPTKRTGNHVLYEVFHNADCQKAFAEYAKQPVFPGLDARIDSFGILLKEVTALNNEAYEYYDGNHYLDDGLAKGRALHPKLQELFREFIAAESELMTELDKVIVPLIQRDIERAKNDPLRFRARSALWKASQVMELANAFSTASVESLDMEGLVKTLGELAAHTQALETAVAAADNAPRWSKNVVDNLKAFTKQAHSFRRSGANGKLEQSEEKDVTWVRSNADWDAKTNRSPFMPKLQSAFSALIRDQRAVFGGYRWQ